MKQVVRIVCGLALMSMVLGGCFVKKTSAIEESEATKKEASGGNFTLDPTNETQNSRFAADAVTEEDLGVPFYPGSEALPSSATMTSDQIDLELSMRTTPDSVVKVRDFYKAKLKPYSESLKDSGTTKTLSIFAKLENGDDVTLTADQAAGAPTTISLTVTRRK